MLYWYLPRATNAALDAATQSATTAFAASVTIVHRMALLATPTMLVGPFKQAEAMRMVSEKMDAATEGAFEAAIETNRLMIRSAFSPIGPDEFARSLVAIGTAAVKPAARRARANAKRLSGG